MLLWPSLFLLPILFYIFSPDDRRNSRQNATFLTLCRNEDLYQMLETVQSVEDRFNSKFKYDWVFLNDQPFTEEFKQRIRPMISGDTKFGLIDEAHWSIPEFINTTKFQESLDSLKDKVVYGDSESYRHMCRWYSGFFQWHSLLLPYKYYWRVEPEVKFYCDIDYDVFDYMEQNGFKYSFIISILEYKVTIENLFRDVVDFFNEKSELVQQNIPENENLYDFIIEDGGYNLCHFWTNFEIGDLSVFRSELYTQYFEFIDSRGGFFYERYGDGPVRSIFLSLFLEQNQVHWINDFGYRHPPYLQCPADAAVRLGKRCSCDESSDFTFHDYSCTGRYLAVTGRE